MWGVHRSTSLMSSSLLLQQCPTCLVRLTWIVFMMPFLLASKWCIHTAVSTRQLPGRNCVSFYRSGLISIWSTYSYTHIFFFLCSYIYIYIYIYIRKKKIRKKLTSSILIEISCPDTCKHTGIHVYIYLKDLYYFINIFISIRGLAENFIGWSRYSHGISANEVYFSTWFPCGPLISSISVAMLGSN